MKISKTKLGASLLGLSAILATIGGWLSGTIDTTSAVTALIAEVGAVITAFGIRDWPILNGVKK